MQQMKVLKRQFHELSIDPPAAAESSPMLALVQALSVHTQAQAHSHTHSPAHSPAHSHTHAHTLSHTYTHSPGRPAHSHSHSHLPHSHTHSPRTPTAEVFATPPRTPLYRFAQPLSSSASVDVSERPRKTPRRSVTFADPLTVVSVVSIVSVCEEEVETEIDTEIDEEIDDEHCTHTHNNKSKNNNDENDDFDRFVERDGEFFRPFSDFLSPSALAERESPSVSSSGRRHADLTKSFSVYEGDAETESCDGFADDEREHVFRSARRALVFDD